MTPAIVAARTAKGNASQNPVVTGNQPISGEVKIAMV